MHTRYEPPAPDAYASGEAALSETANLEALTQPVDFGMSERRRAALWLALLLAAALVLQVFAGAYRTETGNYSDESAHFMNALLLRDYVTHAFGQAPFAFAEQYYLSYPKIAPLMWPPFFHTLLGVFLLPGWPPHQAALVFLAIAAALTAYRLSRFVRLYSSRPVAISLAALFLLSPIIVDLSTAVMVDIVLIGLALEATWWLARYYVSGEHRHVLLFGLFATCCCLTKGNGLAITLVPLLLILATGRAHLLRTRGIYTAAAMVAVVAGPFAYISYRLCDSMGDFTGTGATHTLSRGLGFGAFLFHELTPVPFALALLGAVVAVRRAWTLAPRHAHDCARRAGRARHRWSPVPHASAARVLLGPLRRDGRRAALRSRAAGHRRPDRHCRLPGAGPSGDHRCPARRRPERRPHASRRCRATPARLCADRRTASALPALRVSGSW